MVCSSLVVCIEMNTPLLYYVLVTRLVIIFTAEPNSPCTTPNGEKASCVPIQACPVIQEAILTLTGAAVEFARRSQCGYTDTPLVCCGSSGYPIYIENPPESHLLPNPKECGIEWESNRVHGGTITELNEFPWMALLEYKHRDGKSEGFKCGGTLINARYVITAGHCILTNGALSLSSVRLGEWKLSEELDCYINIATRECNDPVIDIGIETAIVHPHYSRSNGNNDIGLIRLEHNVKFSETVKPICLPTYYRPHAAVGTNLIVSGWGSNENSSQSDVKLKIEVPIIASSICKNIIRNSGAITDNQICAGGIEGRDACQGDSGGPLMGTFKNKTTGVEQWYLEGIVAWGVGCARKDVPGIYTRVSRYMMWILESMAPF